MTEEQLNRGYWWVTHKVQARKVFTAAFGVAAFSLLGYAIFGYADWFFGSGVPERAQMAQMPQPWINYAFFRDAEAPRPLKAESPIVLPAGEKKYDIVAKAVNPNPQWWVEFEYSFGEKIPARKGYLLPGDTRYLSLLGYQSDTRPAVGELKMENLVWHRVNLHATRPDFATWANSRLNFHVTDAQFAPPSPSDPVPVWRASFTVANDTGFGYFNVGFFVTLLSGSRVVGVNQVVITDLRPGDQREVDASWFTDIPTVTKVEVRPAVNIFDDRIYIPPGK